MSKLGLETKFSKLGVETKLRRLGVEIKGTIEEANSRGSMKLLMYCSKPAVVETIVDRKDKEEIYPKDPILFAKFKRRESRNVVLTKFNKLGVEIRLSKFGVETKCKRLGVDTILTKLGVETKLRRFAVDRNP